MHIDLGKYEKYSEFNQKLVTGLNRYRAEALKHACDKHALKFNGDDRFKVSKPVYVWLSSHLGYYGNSGCTTTFNLPDEQFRSLLLEYINENQNDILDFMLKRSAEIAESEKEKALRTLDQVRAKIVSED